MTVSKRRVLARRVAVVLTDEDLSNIQGEGISRVGTGCSDAEGRSTDIEANDCTVGADTYTPAPGC